MTPLAISPSHHSLHDAQETRVICAFTHRAPRALRLYKAIQLQLRGDARWMYATPLRSAVMTLNCYAEQVSSRLHDTSEKTSPDTVDETTISYTSTQCYNTLHLSREFKATIMRPTRRYIWLWTQLVRVSGLCVWTERYTSRTVMVPILVAESVHGFMCACATLRIQVFSSGRIRHHVFHPISSSFRCDRVGDLFGLTTTSTMFILHLALQNRYPGAIMQSGRFFGYSGGLRSE